MNVKIGSGNQLPPQGLGESQGTGNGADSLPPLTKEERKEAFVLMSLQKSFFFELNPTQEALVARLGNSAEAPRSDDPTRERGDNVGKFFKSIGAGIGSALKAVGNFFSGIASGIQKAFAARTGVEPGAQQVNGAQPTTAELSPSKKAYNAMTKELVQSYKDDYKALGGDPKPTVAEFFDTIFPTDASPVDPNSVTYVGEALEGIRDNVSFSDDLGQEIFDELMTRLEEHPDLNALVGSSLSDEMRVLEQNPGAFLRGGDSFSKIQKMICNVHMPTATVVESISENIRQQVSENAQLGQVDDGGFFSIQRCDAQQTEMVLQLADQILDDLLSLDPAKEGSLKNTLSDEFLSFLQDAADTVVNSDDVPQDAKEDAVGVIYKNSLFLRGVNGALTIGLNNSFEFGSGEQNLAKVACQIAQKFLNGAVNTNSDNQQYNDGFAQLRATHNDRMTAFLQSLGMPSVD